MAVRNGPGSGPTFKDIMTPGFCSDDKSTWESRKTYGPPPEPPTKEPKVAISKPVKASKPPEIASPEDQELAKAASCITAWFQANPNVSLVLGEPVALTVLKGDLTYSKRSMIGGESFELCGCYVGKKKNLVYTFRPTQASDFHQAEMSATEASKAFGATFGTILNGMYLPQGTTGATIGASKNETEADIKAKNEVNYVGMGFGSW